MATASTREYNPSTGNLIGNVNSLQFGNVVIGKSSAVKVIDLIVADVTYISNVTLEIVSSDLVTVNASPTDIGADGSAGNGNFGVEYSSEFLPRRTITRFFAGIEDPVTVGTRAGNISNYVYLNIKMNSDSTGAGAVTYRWQFDFS